MSRKIGDFTVWIDESIDTNEIKVHESLIEQNNLQNVKITKGNKRMYLDAIGGSSQKSEVQLNSSSKRRLDINKNEKVEMGTCGVIDNVIQKLTLGNFVSAFGLLASSLSLLLIILEKILPFSYVKQLIVFFLSIYIIVAILSYILKRMLLF